MAAKKSIVLITGANSGLGFGLAAQLLSDAEKHVLLGSRSAEKGEAAIKDLQARGLPGTVELLQVDVTDEESILAAAKTVEAKHGRLDALVNNAAVGEPPGSVAQKMAQCYQTNTIGAFLMAEAFVHLLKKSTGTPRLINVSSGAGSITRVGNPETSFFKDNKDNRDSIFWGIAYSSSKAAMNLVTAAQSVIYGKEGFKVFVYTPGFVISNLGPHNNAENGAQPASEGAIPMIKILNGERDDEHAAFLTRTAQYPW